MGVLSDTLGLAITGLNVADGLAGGTVTYEPIGVGEQVLL